MKDVMRLVRRSALGMLMIGGGPCLGCGAPKRGMSQLLEARHYREALCNDEATAGEVDALARHLTGDLAVRGRIEWLPEESFTAITGIPLSYGPSALRPARLTIESDRIAIDELSFSFGLGGGAVVVPPSRAAYAMITREPAPPNVVGTRTTTATFNNLVQFFKIATIVGPLISPVRFDSKEERYEDAPPDVAFEETAPIASRLFAKTAPLVFSCVRTHGEGALTTGRRCDGLLLLHSGPEPRSAAMLTVEVTFLAEATSPTPSIADSPTTDAQGRRVVARNICTRTVTVRGAFPVGDEHPPFRPLAAVGGVAAVQAW